MIRSLWFKLSVAFTVIGILSMVVLGLVTSAYIDYGEFKRIVVPETVATAVLSSHMFFTEAIKHPEARQWLIAAQKEMVDDVLNMTSNDGEFYIGLASYPEMHYRVYDNAGDLFFQYPEQFSESAAKTFAQCEYKALDEGNQAITLGKPGLIWVRQTLLDIGGGRHGHIEVLLNADVDVWKMIREVLFIDEDEWHAFVPAFSLVGLMCGLIANLFVTRKLRIMNTVASSWSAGNFSLRIPVGEKSSDTFAEHSRILNVMASELEVLVDLRQKAAVAEERNRVARELHDTVKQNLFALKLQLVAAKHKMEGSSAKTHIEEAQRITREAQQDILCMLTQLNSFTLDERGFYGRLVALSDDMTRRYGVSIHWKRKDQIEPTLAEEQALLRIVQEAMNNSVRHGRATIITLDAFTMDARHNLDIIDNGIGLPDGVADANLSGMGLVFMRERARDLPDGDLSIANNAKGGATVQVAWRVT